MFPEILRVGVEEGGDINVPLTPSTTFQDVSACVRDPGEPLPIILEQSPLGARVVGSWERPLELLRLWGNLKSQIGFIASYKLSQQLDSDSFPINTKCTQIDPWELYDLKDELKNMPRQIHNKQNSLDEDWVSSESFDSPFMDTSTSTFNSESLEASYNSHVAQKSPRYSLDHQRIQLQKLLQESRSKDTFQRRKMFTSSLPHRRAIGPPNMNLDKEHSPMGRPKTVGEIKRRRRDQPTSTGRILNPEQLYPSVNSDPVLKYNVSQQEKAHLSRNEPHRVRSRSLERSEPRPVSTASLFQGLNGIRQPRKTERGGQFNYEGMKDQQTSMKLVPEGGEVTVSELREMAYRQQHQIENQQQLLVAREQRLKYLKMQEGKAAQVNMESEKLRRLRERVEAQESKLRRLRALRGQVDSSGLTAVSLSSDLDTMRNLFSEKEKELVMAVAKVDELTRQIEHIRNGTANTNNHTNSNHLHKHHQELDKLRRELLYRNSVNREASVKVSNQRESLANRKEEIHRIDKRIAELQQRLQKKKVLNQQLATQISAATQAKQAHLKAMQQKELSEGIRENSTDDIATDDHRIGDGLSEFERVKQDPKYQTLPYNTKFSSGRPRAPYEVDSSTDSLESSVQVSSTSTKQEEPNQQASNESRLQYNRPDLPNTHGGPEHKAHLPQTSLSLSFGHKLSPGVTSLSQNRFNQQYLKEVGAAQQQNESVDCSDGDITSRPQLPPKPPCRPMPPPRQKGEPGSFEVLHASPHRVKQLKPQQAVRYASGNVIVSTYTQKEQQTASPNDPTENSAFKASDSLETSDKVRVSINRRIEMPPDFMFPENQSPPYDLIGRSDDTYPDAVSSSSIAPPVSQPPTSEIMYPRVTSAGTTQHKGTVPKGKLSEIIKQSENASKTSDSNGSLSSKHFHSIHNNNNMENGTTNDSTMSSDAKKSPTEKESIEIKEQDTTENKTEDSANNNIVDNTEIGSTAEPDSDTSIKGTKKGNLKSTTSKSVPRRVSFDPLALLLDASLEGELELVKKTAKEVPNPSAANDEGITALHNAICAGHLDIVTFLVMYGYDVNAQDADGWTPLHCAASCNNVQMARFLVEHGACVLATTLLDHETAAEKCEQEEDGFDSCSQYLYSVQEKLGIMNGGVVYAVYDYESQNDDELSFQNGDAITVLRRGDEYERQWWWSRVDEKCGYIPRNLLGLYPRVKSSMKES